MLRLLLKTPNDPALLLPRLTLGVVFLHGAQKVLGWFGGDGFRGMKRVAAFGLALALSLRGGGKASVDPVLATKVQG